MVRREVLAEGVEVYCGDMLDLLPTVSAIDAILTDPPYGLGKKMQGGTWGAKDEDSGFLKWDLEAKQAWIDLILALKVPSVIWGGNYFDVPSSRCWLLWNKINAVPTMADAEMAWTNLDRPAKRFDAPVGRVEFGHPTSKPLALIEWCLGFLPKEKHVVDPFMGSGTTGVACVKAGKNFTGIEIDGAYFDIACRRIEAALKQPDMFIDPPKPMKQEAFL